MKKYITYKSDVLPKDTDYNDNFFKEYMKVTNTLSNYDILSQIQCVDDSDTLLFESLNPMDSFENIGDVQNKKVIFFIPDVTDWDYTNERFQKLLKEDIKIIFNETILNSEKQNFNFEFICLNRFATNINVQVHGYKKSLLDIFWNSKNYYRQFHFNCFNNTVKEHRIDILRFMCDTNLTEKGIVSWFAGGDADLNLLKDIKFSEKEKSFIGKSHDLKVVGQQDYLNFIPYFNSYFSVITESNWYIHDGKPLQKIHITEKTFKAFVTMSPFLIIGCQYHLKKLKEWGFKTFEGYMDESYDELESYEQRKKVIYSEILRLNRMDKKELDDWFWSMKDILLHNYNHFFKFVDNEMIKLENIIYE